MNSNQLILSLALFAACAVAVLGAPSSYAEAPNVEQQPQQEQEVQEPLAQETQQGRVKRLVPFPVVATAHSFGYSYLGAYPNAVHGVRYAPAIAAYHPVAPVVSPVLY